MESNYLLLCEEESEPEALFAGLSRAPAARLPAYDKISMLFSFLS
jgi:hypothetical protein